MMEMDRLRGLMVKMEALKTGKRTYQERGVGKIGTPYGYNGLEA
jgi:hypothetical protein